MNINSNLETFNNLNEEIQEYITVMFNFIDFINNNNLKITYNESNSIKRTTSFTNQDSIEGLAMFLSILYINNDYKNFFNKEGITLNSILKQCNKSIKKDFEIKNIKNTDAFKKLNLKDILDAVISSEKDIYGFNIDINDSSIEDNISINDMKIFQFLNFIISYHPYDNYILLLAIKLFKLEDYFDEVIVPELIDLINLEAQSYYSKKYDYDIELLDDCPNVKYKFSDVNIIQYKDNCYLKLNRQYEINGTKIPKYLKLNKIEINDKVYTGINMIKTLLFGNENEKITFYCEINNSPDINFSIFKDLFLGKSKQSEHLNKEDFIKYLVDLSNEITDEELKKDISKILSKIHNNKINNNQETKKEVKKMQAKEQTPLSIYGENLNECTYIKDPSIGRDDDIKKIERILLYPEKDKSIIITGPAGTGKTALVKGLSYRLQKRLVPDALKDLKIVSIDVPSIVAGCKYVGMLEEKLKSILDEVSQDENTILFIDEIHQAMGAGRSEGNKVTVSEILKPYLDYGKIRIIGATTDEEYEEMIEPNTAFKSRLKRIKIKEPENHVIYEIVDDLITAYNKISYSKLNVSEDEKYNIINWLIKVTESKYRVYNDKVNNPRLILDIVKESYAIAALDNRNDVTIEDFILAIEDEERLYNSAKNSTIRMLNTNNKKPEGKILKFPKK